MAEAGRLFWEDEGNRQKRSQLLKDLWRKAATPKKRGRPKGKKEQGRDARINVIAYCLVTGMSNYQIATYWQSVTGQRAAKTTIDSFVADHAIEIEERKSLLSGLRDPERDATSGLPESQRKVVKEMAGARRKKAAL